MRSRSKVPWFGRSGPPQVDVLPGERVLAWCTDRDGAALAGTRDALYLPGVRLSWEDIQAADWDRETSALRVSEVGAWGEPRREHVFTIDDPARFLELVRERISASVVLQRHVPLTGRRGLRVVARRAPRGDRQPEWFVEYDDGVDPGDPAVVSAAREALRLAKAEIGQH